MIARFLLERGFMRKFEKISYEEFKKNIKDDKILYDSYLLPTRKTTSSAGYDIASLIDYELSPNECVTIPTGIKSTFNSDEVLLIFIRSSLGFKYNIRLVNQVGVIDSDYYNNMSNEGHIMIRIKNEGNENFKINIGDRIAQGIFVKYEVVDNENKIDNIRTGGFGSTNKNA